MATTYNISIVVQGKDQGASSMLRGISGGLGGLAQIAGGILTAGFLYKIGQGIMDIGRYAFDTVGKMQQLKMSLETLAAQEIMSTGGAETLTQALEKAGPVSERLLHWLRELSFTSPFSYETVAQAFTYQKAFGGTIETAKLTAMES